MEEPDIGTGSDQRAAEWMLLRVQSITDFIFQINEKSKGGVERILLLKQEMTSRCRAGVNSPSGHQATG